MASGAAPQKKAGARHRRLLCNRGAQAGRRTPLLLGDAVESSKGSATQPAAPISFVTLTPLPPPPPSPCALDHCPLTLLRIASAPAHMPPGLARVTQRLERRHDGAAHGEGGRGHAGGMCVCVCVCVCRRLGSAAGLACIARGEARCGTRKEEHRCRCRGMQGTRGERLRSSAQRTQRRTQRWPEDGGHACKWALVGCWGVVGCWCVLWRAERRQGAAWRCVPFISKAGESARTHTLMLSSKRRHRPMAGAWRMPTHGGPRGALASRSPLGRSRAAARLLPPTRTAAATERERGGT
jgi:hypothetical protein